MQGCKNAVSMAKWLQAVHVAPGGSETSNLASQYQESIGRCQHANVQVTLDLKNAECGALQKSLLLQEKSIFSQQAMCVVACFLRL